jgi:hypothetical protein
VRLFCDTKTPVKETLDIWPPLPVALSCNSGGVDNTVAALELNDRISELHIFRITSSQFKKILAAMQQPFPALTSLNISYLDEFAAVVPPSFLGGSAPSLRSLTLHHVAFPEIPKLLLCATHLVELSLWNIPQSGYFSPEAMATSLSVLTKLESLQIGFEFPQSRPDRGSQRPPSPTRTLLPVLTELIFRGVGEYVEDFVARIDTPLLDTLTIFFDQLILDTTQLTRFISRTPNFKAHDEAHVYFSDKDVSVTLSLGSDDMKGVHLSIPCIQPDLQLSFMALVCSSSFPQGLTLTVERLYIQEPEWESSQEYWRNSFGGSQWLELLRPFTAVKELYISHEFVPRIMPALQELVGDRVIEVLPVLRSLFLEEKVPSGSVQDSIGQFIAARQLSSHPITVSRWENSGERESFEN